jgi:hypothetical protein
LSRLAENQISSSATGTWLSKRSRRIRHSSERTDASIGGTDGGLGTRTTSSTLAVVNLARAGGLAHIGARTLDALEHALLGEQSQRFAQRADSHPQPLGQRGLRRQPLTPMPMPGLDLPRQQLGNLQIHRQRCGSLGGFHDLV